MKIFLLVIVFCIGKAAIGQTTEVDSCAITPSYSAAFEGMDKKGMLGKDDVAKLRKMIPTEEGVTILRFTYSIDCDGCDIYIQDVYGNTFPEEELKVLAAIKPMRVLSFECIVGKDKKGQLVAFKPFLFYIKP